MGLSLTLTDQELPASPAFIEFLHATLTGADYVVGQWHAQDEEILASHEGRYQDIERKAALVVADPQGKAWLLRAYRLFKALLTGDAGVLGDLQRFQFMFVVGMPRTGGTYLTKQLFRAAGIDYRGVQNALAHDGFPHLSRVSFRASGNVQTNGLLQLAEYLTMVEVFFGRHGDLKLDGRVLVPKKFTKAVYAFDLIHALLPGNARYLITIRHPLAVCQSVLDKSGGMPAGERFAVRSAIERWALHDWLQWGSSEQQVLAMNYVDVMVGYWKRFHLQLAMTGMPLEPSATVVPYGAEPMTRAAEQLYQGLGVELDPEVFKVAPPPDFAPVHQALAERAITEVAGLWGSLGMRFPAAELASAC